MYRDALPTMIERWRWLDAETRALVGSLRARGERPPVSLDDAVSAIDAPMVLDVWCVEGDGFWAGSRVQVGLLTTAR